MMMDTATGTISTEDIETFNMKEGGRSLHKKRFAELIERMRGAPTNAELKNIIVDLLTILERS